jgi:DNA polymerase-1
MSDINSTPVKAGDHVYLIDGSGYIFRAYHAIPPLSRKSDGLPVNAVQGFCSMLNKLLREMAGPNQPTHLAVIFDKSGKTFRNDIFPQYKANRPPAPEDLVPQFGLIKQAVTKFDVPSIELAGFEADDLIATYARHAQERDATVRIVSSDKDLMQLVSDKVVMYDSMKDRLIDHAGVIEKFGVGPDKVIDVQALAGDSVDNVPGVPGIGVKTGALLINEYGDLETLLSRAQEIKQPKRRENLIEFADQARMSKQLVTLDRNVPVEVELDAFGLTDTKPSKLIGFLKAMEFTALTKRVARELDVEAEEIDPVEVDIDGWEKPVAETAQTSGDTAALLDLPFDAESYQTVTETGQLKSWIEAAFERGYVCFDTETNSLDALRADLVGISLAIEPGKACYVPLGHRSGEGLFDDGGVAQINFDEALALLKPMLEDPAVLKIAQNFKYDFLVLRRYGINVAPFDDTMLLSYALDSGLGGHGMDELSRRHLDHKPIPFKEIAGTGKSAITFDLVPVDQATKYAAEDADVTLRLWKLLKPRIGLEHRATVYETLERPLVPVLAQMESEGILVDRAKLAKLSGEFATNAARLEDEIHELAGEKFNPGSPKQLGEILFGKMGIESGKKTATGAWSTDVRVMEELARDGVELAQKVLDWRQVSKLKSTYSDALPLHINPDTGRVHTSYSMAATSTGRLASTDPNLQNIPVRTEAGRKIRQAFVADKGNKLVSADYSQIELRIMAHVADIPQLKQAFEDGLDIHAMTASEMFNVPIEGMDPMVRRNAKAINFGIIYGISAFGLANQLNISRTEAGDYIKTYFERFPAIKDYMEVTKQFAHDHGYVETIFGRRCHFPRISSKNGSERSFQERAAINAPIQGSAADVIRRAMVKMPGALRQAGIKARMLLQVHDELIFEVAEAGVDDLISTVVGTMENAPKPALTLSVPLTVDARAADNWDEAH